jgi:hypothetical protein
LSARPLTRWHSTLRLPSFDPELDKGPKALRCRALLLSPETLAALTAGDGGFAGVRDPNFCARGAGDAGM